MQLRLPGWVLLITLAFGALLGTGLYASFWHVYEYASFIQPVDLRERFEAQTAEFLLVAAIGGLAWATVILGSCANYLRRLLGPAVAMRRQVAAMHAGDYGARIQLRKGDALADLAHELNALSEKLEKRTDLDPPQV